MIAFRCFVGVMDFIQRSVPFTGLIDLIHRLLFFSIVFIRRYPISDNFDMECILRI